MAMFQGVDLPLLWQRQISCALANPLTEELVSVLFCCPPPLRRQCTIPIPVSLSAHKMLIPHNFCSFVQHHRQQFDEQHPETVLRENRNLQCRGIFQGVCADGNYQNQSQGTAVIGSAFSCELLLQFQHVGQLNISFFLQTLLECVRLRTFGRYGLQQIQVDTHYLQLYLWRFVSDEK